MIITWIIMEGRLPYLKTQFILEDAYPLPNNQFYPIVPGYSHDHIFLYCVTGRYFPRFINSKLPMSSYSLVNLTPSVANA